MSCMWHYRYGWTGQGSILRCRRCSCSWIGNIKDKGWNNVGIKYRFELYWGGSLANIGLLVGRIDTFLDKMYSLLVTCMFGMEIDIVGRC